MTLTKPIANQIAKERLYQWRKRNEAMDEIYIPVVLLSVVNGDKTGIALNITQDVPLPDILKLLELATEQVKLAVKTSPSTPSTPLPPIKKLRGIFKRS